MQEAVLAAREAHEALMNLKNLAEDAELEAVELASRGIQLLPGRRPKSVSFLVENNTPVEVIKAWIGHGSERMIRRYTHLRPPYRSRVLASIPSLIGSRIDVFDPLTQEAVA